MPLVTASLLLWLMLGLSPGCDACNLTQTSYDATTGLLHRCLNVSGTNQWQMNVACWLKPLGSSGAIKELEVGENYKASNGQVLAECRRRWSSVALVYRACLNATTSKDDSSPKWPGDVWAGSDGLNYTCTDASPATTSYYNQGSRVILYGCKSASGRIVHPGKMDLHDRDGITRLCIFSGTDNKAANIQYFLHPFGCWLRNLTDPTHVIMLNFSQQVLSPYEPGRNRSLLATCKQRWSGKEALVHHHCRENDTLGEVLRPPGSNWTGRGGLQLECLPAEPSDLASAKVITRGCYQNSTLLPPGSEVRISDGTISRCTFNRYKSAYGWYETVGCWLMDPLWLKVTSASPNLRAGEDFCLGKTCLATCAKQRYGNRVVLVSKVCYKDVGKGAIYRLPYANWTDESGVNKTCLPMADQSRDFGVGAATISNGCVGRAASVPPGTLSYENNFIVHECTLNARRREFDFTRSSGCWMHNSSGHLVQIAPGESLKLSNGSAVATCRKTYSSVEFIVDVCFKNKFSSPLKWAASSIAFPGYLMANGSSVLQCNPSARYSGGINAKWIVYGCPSETGIASPGSKILSSDGIIRECRHNQKEGGAAAYDWKNEIGCWFRDHENLVHSIMQVNVAYNHSGIGKPAAICKKVGYSSLELHLFFCFSVSNSHFYSEGERWMDSMTGLVHQCIQASGYVTGSVKEIEAGCWLNQTVDRAGNLIPTRLPQFFRQNGSLAYGTENRVKRCDFNKQSSRFEWLTSVACWLRNATGDINLLDMGQEVRHKGMLLFKCQETRDGAKLVQHACEHNGTWHSGLSVWRDSSYQYKCVPASGHDSAKVQKTHCITDSGGAIQESQKINGIQYVCMQICGILVFFRDPTPIQYRALNSLISSCSAINSNIINNLG